MCPKVDGMMKIWKVPPFQSTSVTYVVILMFACLRCPVESFFGILARVFQTWTRGDNRSVEQHQFKARPFRPDGFGVGGEKGVFRPQHSDKQLTQPAPFRLSTENRAASRAPR